MAGTFLNLLRIVGDLGLVMASTQRQHLSNDQLSTLYWINVVGGIFLALIAIASTPLLVRIYHEPRIFDATAVLSITLVGIGFGAQHEAILRRRLRYGYLHGASLLATTVGLSAGVISALSGLGLWSLVLYQVTTRATHTLVLWWGTRWMPSRPCRVKETMQLLRYGLQFIPVQLVTHLSRSVGEVVVGAGAGAADLGLYRRAHGIAMLVEQVKQPLKSIMPASLSRLQQEPRDFFRFYFRSLSIWSVVACGVVGFVSTESTVVVQIVLGEQWLSASPLVRWLGPAALATALGAATEWLLLPLGEVRRLLFLRVVRASCIAAGVVIGWGWGISGVALGYSVAACIGVATELSVMAASRRVDLLPLVTTFGRPVIAASAASLVALVIRTVPTYGWVVMEGLLYATVFMVAHSLLPGGWVVTRRLFHTVRDMLYAAR